MNLSFRQQALILQDFEYGKLERHHLDINIVSHNKIEYEEYYVTPKHRIRKIITGAADEHSVYIPYQ